MADDDTPEGDEAEDELPAEVPAHVPGTAQNMAGTIIDLAIEDELKGSYLTYAMSVIVSRALPDVRDGLKPSQRRILVAMNDLNLSPGAARVKCAKISGDTSGNYHPHGESVIYPTLVRMAQEWNMRHLLIDKQGNFGSIAGLPAAAMRYTEARMSPIAALLMEDIKLDTVDFIPTYDERRLEPTVLPSKFPNLLVNGANGIAVGMATSVPPHNLREVCRAAIRLIDEPSVTIDELLTIVEGPDFPTGGIICGRSGIRRGYHTGRGTVTVRARARIEEVGKRTRIVVSEIPFQQTRDRVVLSIADMVNEDKIKGISAIRDESDLKEPVRLIIELKRDADAEVVLNQLYKFSPLQDTFSLIFLALVDGKPRTLNLKEMLHEYVRHRVIVLRRRTQFLLNRARQRKHTVEGLLLAHANIDEVIRVIRTSATQAEAKTRLMQIETPSALMERALGPVGYADFTLERGGAQESYRLTAVQAEAILRMTLGQLVNLEQEKLGGEYQELLTEIAEYLRILSDDANIYAIIRADLEDMARRYGDDRRTKIDPIDASGIEDESLIEEENMVVTISTAGYIKRTPTTTYRAQRRGGKGITGAKNDDEDPIRNLFVASTHDYLLFFTNIGKVYWRKVYDLPQLARESKGRAIVNVLSLADGETVAYCTAIRDFTLPNHYLLMATRKGLVKKTPLEQYGRPLKTGLIAIKLKEGDELVDVAVTKTGDEILLATTGGMAIRFDQADARAMGRNTSGVKGIKLSKGQAVVGMVVADPEATLLTACQNGYGKRTPFGPNDPLTGTRVEVEAAEGDVVEPEVVESAEAGEDDESSSNRYRTQNRGGKGIRDIKTTPRNGPVVGIVRVDEADELLMITAGGKIQRITAKSVSEIGRNTQGVRIMSLDEGDTLAAVVRVPPEEISPADETEPPSPAAGTSSPPAPPATDS